MVTIDALPSTLDSFKHAIAAGVDRDTAFAVALAKYRALHPCADEGQVRALLAHGSEELDHAICEQGLGVDAAGARGALAILDLEVIGAEEPM